MLFEEKSARRQIWVLQIGNLKINLIYSGSQGHIESLKGAICFIKYRTQGVLSHKYLWLIL